MSKIARLIALPLAAMAVESCLARDDAVPEKPPGQDSGALDWPRWLGPDYNGVSKETGWLKKWPEAGPPRLWSQKIGLGYSGIIVTKISAQRKKSLLYRTRDL